MKLIPYLMFTHGRCREAFDFYARALGGTVIAVSTYGEMPGADQQLPPSALPMVANAQLVAAGAVIMGSDNVMGEETGERRNDTTVNVDVETAEDAERIYAALSAGGKVEMPMGETSWAVRFGMLTDRYGKPWMVNCSRKPTAENHAH